jgi:hypothetical protein
MKIRNKKPNSIFVDYLMAALNSLIIVWEIREKTTKSMATPMVNIMDIQPVIPSLSTNKFLSLWLTSRLSSMRIITIIITTSMSSTGGPSN